MMCTDRPPHAPPSSCEICEAQQAGTALAPLAGLRACVRCREGDVLPVMEHHGYEAESFFRELGKGRSSASGWQAQVNLVRPYLGLELEVEFSRQKGAHGWFARWLKKTDPEIGLQAFDDNVFIEVSPETEKTMRSLLENAGVREAILWLVGAGCGVSLVGRDMIAGAMEWNKQKLPEVADVARYTLALAIHMDRFARGEQTE